MKMLNTLVKKIKEAWKKVNMTPEDRYLNEAIDLVDYESRLHKILFRNHNDFPPLRGA